MTAHMCKHCMGKKCNINFKDCEFDNWNYDWKCDTYRIEKYKHITDVTNYSNHCRGGSSLFGGSGGFGGFSGGSFGGGGSGGGF